MDFPKSSEEPEPTLGIDEEDGGYHRATQAALFLLILTIPILVISILTARLGEGSLDDCTALTEEELRLACYDHYTRHMGGHPAKGAGAPYSSNG
jgi:hypothetical protein